MPAHKIEERTHIQPSKIGVPETTATIGVSGLAAMLMMWFGMKKMRVGGKAAMKRNVMVDGREKEMEKMEEKGKEMDSIQMQLELDEQMRDVDGVDMVEGVEEYMEDDTEENSISESIETFQEDKVPDVQETETQADETAQPEMSDEPNEIIRVENEERDGHNDAEDVYDADIPKDTETQEEPAKAEHDVKEMSVDELLETVVDSIPQEHLEAEEQRDMPHVFDIEPHYSSIQEAFSPSEIATSVTPIRNAEGTELQGPESTAMRSVEVAAAPFHDSMKTEEQRGMSAALEIGFPNSEDEFASQAKPEYSDIPVQIAEVKVLQVNNSVPLTHFRWRISCLCLPPRML